MLNGVEERRRRLEAETNANQKTEKSGTEGCWDPATAPCQTHNIINTPTEAPKQKGHEGSFNTTHFWAWHCAPAVLGTQDTTNRMELGQLPLGKSHQCQLCTTTIKCWAGTGPRSVSPQPTCDVKEGRRREPHTPEQANTPLPSPQGPSLPAQRTAKADF